LSWLHSCLGVGREEKKSWRFSFIHFFLFGREGNKHTTRKSKRKRGRGGRGASTYKRGQEEADDEEEDVSAAEVGHCG